MNKKSLATFGGGCFWCLDAAYRKIRGVTASVCGYAGGDFADPTYALVESGQSGHAEVVQLEFDPEVISYEDLLDIFLTIHDPTSLNKQGHDEGPQYRSIILYHDDAQKKAAGASLKEAQRLWGEPIVTEIMPLKHFYKAEDEHQNFYETHPELSYCQVIINPKLQKLQEKFATLLKVSA